MEIKMDLKLPKLQEIIRVNAETIVNKIEQLKHSVRSETGGYLYMYYTRDGILKIGRTAQKFVQIRLDQQKQYEQKEWLIICMIFL